MGCAAINEQLICLKLLRKMGADVNVQDDQGRTCLSLAAYQVTSSCFMFCISTYLDLYNMSKVCLHNVSNIVCKNIFMHLIVVDDLMFFRVKHNYVMFDNKCCLYVTYLSLQLVI